MKSSRGSGAGRAVDRKKQFDPASSGIAKHHGDADMYRVSPHRLNTYLCSSHSLNIDSFRLFHIIVVQSHFSKHSSSGGDSSNDKVIHLKFYDGKRAFCLHKC